MCIRDRSKRMLGIAIAQLTEVYLKLGNYKEAKKNCDEGIVLLGNLGRTDQRAIPTLYRLKGIIAEHEGNDELALEYFTKSLNEAERIKISFERVKSTCQIGVFYAARNDTKKGKKFCNKSYKDAKKYRYTNLEIDACDCLYKISNCLLYTSPSPRDLSTSRMPSSA